MAPMTGGANAPARPRSLGKNHFLSGEVRPLRAVAVSAPEAIRGQKGHEALNSSDPFSLYNACRVAAEKARSGQGAWADSNWMTSSRAQLREKFLLMYSLDEMDVFRSLLRKEKPNLLLIGAMTLCMPGAVECARAAREELGDDVLIVLGGRHPSETIFLQARGGRDVKCVCHHPASPARLMAEEAIPPVFDLVVSGEAEYVIPALGEIVAHYPGKARSSEIKADQLLPVQGDWILVQGPQAYTIVSRGVPLPRGSLPSPVSLFGATASFDVFGDRMTAHVYSDTGPGCVYDCAFCSERRSITGGISDIQDAPLRLYRQMADAVQAIHDEHPNRGASAFVEDSILLAGSPKAVSKLCDLLEEQPLDIKFGAQFTIDQILARKGLLSRLSNNGLRYVFVGLETFDPDAIGGMSKDIGGRQGTWQSRFLDVLSFFEECEIMCGCALLFGLGETHEARLNLLDMLIKERGEGRPIVKVSANWAVQHPLRSTDQGSEYRYIDWGTPDDDYLDLFHNFGEASTKYPLRGVDAPALGELAEIVKKMKEFDTIV